jgi:hypothetical protein
VNSTDERTEDADAGYAEPVAKGVTVGADAGGYLAEVPDRGDARGSRRSVGRCGFRGKESRGCGLARKPDPAPQFARHRLHSRERRGPVRGRLPAGDLLLAHADARAEFALGHPLRPTGAHECGAYVDA